MNTTQNSTANFKVYMGTSGLTLNVFLSKQGETAFTDVTAQVTITDNSNGYYDIAPAMAHRDTVGESYWLFVDAGAAVDSMPRREVVVNTLSMATETQVTLISGSIADIPQDLAESQGYINAITNAVNNSDIVSLVEDANDSLAALTTQVNTLTVRVPSTLTQEYIRGSLEGTWTDELGNSATIDIS